MEEPVGEWLGGAMLGATATTSVMFNALVPTIAGANGESVTELDDEADAIEEVV